MAIKTIEQFRTEATSEIESEKPLYAQVNNERREFTKAEYEVSSAYTLVKKGESGKFLYRDSLWRSSDLIGTGVASFSHVNGLHFQNQTHWDEYLNALESDNLPLNRAFVTTHEERLTREMILQLKLGRIKPAYFQEKFGTDILDRYGSVFSHLSAEEMLTFDEREVQLTRQGLLQVDQLLPEFYDSKYRNARYT